MKFVKRTLFCICIMAIFIAQTNMVTASADHRLDTPALIFEDGAAYPVDLIDQDREEGKITVYTGNYGVYTKPFTADTHEFIVADNIVAYKNTNWMKGTYIPPNGYVISYTGADPDLLEKLYVGAGTMLANFAITISPDMYFTLDGMTVPIDGINSERGANNISLFNPSYGTSTKTNAWGMELTVVNNVISKIVDKKNVNGTWLDNNSPIPPDGVVISIHTGSPYYSRLQEKAKVGGPVVISADNYKLYSAGKTAYAAYNPRSLEDNPAAWDKEKNKPYDSYRGPNQLIIYDSGFGSHTGTNPYGYEVVVSSEGKIVKMGGNDSEIPDGGYVLSGHGDRLKWLQKYALLGQSVILNKDTKEAMIIYTPDSYIDMAAYSIKSAQNSMDLAKRQYKDISYDKVQSAIDIAGTKLEHVQALADQGRYEGLINTVKDIQTDANTAYFMTFESAKAENRAVWLRPRENSIDEIKEHLDMLKDININTIYLETYFNGYAIYPTSNEIMPQNPMYNGLDVLDTYIKEAHARGMELHAWVEDFLADQSVAAKKPEWMAVSRKGDRYFLENGKLKYYFMNPALPEVRDFLSMLYKGLTKEYDLDGIQFDYMRYPHSGDYSNDFSYDSYTRQLFKQYAGADPIALKPGEPLWKKWCEFRAYLVSSFAYKIFTEVKSIKPEIKISADVWPDYDKTLIDIYQDPRAWTKQDYINNLIPMSYYLYEGPVADDIRNTQAFAKGHSQITVGLATLTRVDKAVFLRQIDTIRNNDTNGIGIFEFQSLFSGGYDSVLKLGAFSAPAVSTNRDPEKSLNILLKNITRKIDDVYVKLGGMNNEQAEKYKKLVSSIGVDFGAEQDKRNKADNLKHSIDDLLNGLNRDDGLDKEVAKRISFDLNNAKNIINAYISSFRFLAKHEVKEFQVELPLEALRNKKEAPIKVKAVYHDNTGIYLDRTQYEIKTGNSASAEIHEDMLKLKSGKEKAVITVDILPAFSFNTVSGVSKKIEFTVNPDDPNIVDKPAYGSLKASEVTHSEVKLDWRSTVIDSAIAGYIVSRDGKQVARTSADSFNDKDLQTDRIYTYEIYGFDASGKIIYKSNQMKVKTKASFFISEIPGYSYSF